MQWKIEVRNYRCFTDEYPLKIDLSNPVTALIGPNNSGKSAALRFFWEIGKMVALAPSTLVGGPYNDQGVASVNNNFRSFSDPYSVFSAFNDRPITVDLIQTQHSIEHLVVFPDAKKEIELAHLRLTISRVDLQGQVYLIHRGQQVDLIHENFQIKHSTKGALVTSVIDDGQYFINHLIGLYGLDQPTYIPAIRPYGKISVDDHFDLTLGRSLVTGWNAHKASPQPQSREFASSIERELARVFGYKHLEIYPTATQDDLILKINNNRSYQLQDMGAGIGQFLTILLNAIPRGNPLVLFDEPEIGIHASLQIELMSLIAKYANGPIIFATHSLGLARSVADEIISFSMIDGYSRPRKFDGSKNYLETLGELSFSSWREIGCDGVLFVEGPSDVKVISEWLRKIGLCNKWALISLGGSETISSDGVEAIKQLVKVHPKVAVIIDSERNSADTETDKRRTKFRADCVSAKIPCLILEKRALENYFSLDAIKKACGANAMSLEPFEKLANHGWGKRDGLKIATQMTYDEIIATDIVKFIQNHSSASSFE